MSHHVASPPLSHAEPFSHRSRLLLSRFQDELRSLGAAEAPAIAVLMASDFLLHTLELDASWERFELGRFLRFIARSAAGPSLGTYKTTLVAFLSFLARQGEVPSDVAARAELASVPPRAR